MKPDRLSYLQSMLILLVAGLGGCLAVYNSRSFGDDALMFVLRQLIWMVLGSVLFLVLARIPFRIYEKYAREIGVCGMFLLLLVLFAGARVNGMSGWFDIGYGFRFQPSEFAKVPFLLWLSKEACMADQSEGRRFARVSMIGILYCLLVILEPDFGSATVFFMGFLMILFLSGFHSRCFLYLAGGAAICTAVFVHTHRYALNRIAGFLDPDTYSTGAGWHIKQFQYAMAHGGTMGSDWGEAIWSNAYLPLSHSDSAFASIVEAGGLLGGLIVIAGFLVLVYLFRNSAMKKTPGMARMVFFCIGALCAAQALLHIGVNTALLPPTGLTLPIFSYGGSSLIATFGAFGVAFSAAKNK